MKKQRNFNKRYEGNTFEFIDKEEIERREGEGSKVVPLYVYVIQNETRAAGEIKQIFLGVRRTFWFKKRPSSLHVSYPSHPIGSHVLSSPFPFLAKQRRGHKHPPRF